MKIIFNDATEIQAQKVYIDSSRALRIRTLSAITPQERLREIFRDKMKTRKITVKERGQRIAEYENYTMFEGIMAYEAGILEPVLYKAGETMEERLNSVLREIDETKEVNAMLQECILEMSEVVYQ